jgi:hypothetical protein
MLRRAPSRAHIVAIAIALQAIAGLALGLPGHLTEDSIVQLFEARTLQFISFQPPSMSLLLRLFDSWVPGTALFVVTDQLLLTTSFAMLFLGRDSRLRTSALLFALLALANPVLLVYTGIVWKDVLMSHLVVFGYVCLHAAAARPEDGGRRVLVFVGVATLALGVSLRQNALILAIPGAAYAAFLLTSHPLSRGCLAIALPLLVIGSNAAIIWYADSVAVGETIPRTGTGLRSLALFDLAGIAANGGTIPDPAIAAQVSATQVPSYTPLRNDSLPVPTPGSPLWRAETSDMIAVWTGAAATSPQAYLAHRAYHFWSLLWMGGTEELCVPFHTGMVSSVYVSSLGRDIMPELGLRGRNDVRDRRLGALSWRLHPPLFNHVFWLLVVAVAALTMWRRDGVTPLVLMAACALAFTLSFGIIGISCEFRYLYILPVAASLLVFAAAIAPRRSQLHPAPTRRRNGSIGRSIKA